MYFDEVKVDFYRWKKNILFEFGYPKTDDNLDAQI